MKNKIGCAAAFICLVALTGLLFLSFEAEKKGYRDLVMAVPDGAGFPVLDLDKLNEISDEEVPVTYEIKDRVTAIGVSAAHPLTRIGTNSSYADVMDLQVVAGDFISPQSFTMKNRYLVLNRPAAFKLFGGNDIIGNTVTIDGEVWIVTGIVDDGYKKALMAYVPASTLGGSPEMLMAKTKDGSSAVRNSLRRLGLYESDSRMVDVAAVSQLFWQQLLLADYLALGFMIFWFLGRQLRLLRQYSRQVSAGYQTLYLDQLIRANRRKLCRMTVWGSEIMIGFAIILYLARQVLLVILSWRTVIPQIKYLSDYYFQGKMQWLMRFLIGGPVFSLIFAAAAVMGGISIFRRKMYDRSCY